MLLDKILPKNPQQYSGTKFALYAFYILTIFTLIRSCIHMFASDGGAQSIATIPLNQYSIEAGSVIILIFALWGLSQFLMGVVYVVVILRYKGLIPLFYLLIVIEYAARIFFGHWKPIITTGTPPGEVGSYFLIPVAIILFIFSIYPTRKK
jgi:hypothetical protein